MADENARTPQDQAPGDAERRAAQEAAAELARMGIDPGTLGLDAPLLSAPPPPGRHSVPPQGPPAPQGPPSDHPPRPYPPQPYLGQPYQGPSPDYQAAIGRPPMPTQRPPGQSGPPPTGRARVPRPDVVPPDLSDPYADPTELGGPYSGRVLVTLPGATEQDPPRRVWGYLPPPAEHPRAPLPPAEPPRSPYEEPPLTRSLGNPETPPPPVPEEVPVDIAAVQATLQRTADTYDGMVPAGWRRTLRAVTLGLVTPGAAEGVEAERVLVGKVRARRREPSVTVFLAGKGGVGTTTVAAGVGLTLAALRNDLSALVDVRRGPAILGRRLTGRPASTVLGLAQSPPENDPPDLLRVNGALGVVDPAPVELTTGQLNRALQALRSAHAFTLADVGNDVGEAARATLDRADGVVVVTTTSQDAVLSTQLAVERLRESAPQLLPRVTVALVSLTDRQQRRTARRLRDQLRLAIHRIVAVPFDPALAAGAAVDLTRLRPSTREALVRLAAFVVEPSSPADALPAQRYRSGAARVGVHR